MREKVQILTSFWLKIIAFSFMALDHVGTMLLDYYSTSGTPFDPGTPLNYPQSMVGYVFKLIGRIAFPLFILLLADGMRYSKNRSKYITRLATIEAIILVADLVLYLTSRFGKGLGFTPEQSAFSDLLAFALFIYLIEKKGWLKYLSILPVGYIVISFLIDMPALGSYFDPLFSYAPYFLFGDYSLYGFLMFLGFYYAPKLASKFNDSITKNGGAPLNEKQIQSFVNASRVTSIIIINVVFWGISKINNGYFDSYVMQIQTYAMLAVLPIFLHNGRKGYDSKWWRYFEYLFYPVHLALIGLVFALIFM